MTTPIIILILLTSPLLAAFFVSKVKGSKLDVGKFACWGLGIAFIFFSIGHVIKTEGMVEMLPPWVPYRVALIYLTGLLEVVIGVALFVPKLQVNAAKIAIFVLIVFFPANIYAAVNSIGLGGHQWGPVYLLIRTPLQFILISWAYFLCVKKDGKVERKDSKKAKETDQGINDVNSIRSYSKEFENGIVTKQGFSAIYDAEIYGAASSIGAGSVSLAKLWQAFRQGKSLSLYSRTGAMIQPKSEAELAEWCENNFPECYVEFLQREQN